MRTGKVLDRQGAVIYEWFSYQLVYFFCRQICFARPCWLLAPQDDRRQKKYTSWKENHSYITAPCRSSTFPARVSNRQPLYIYIYTHTHTHEYTLYRYVIYTWLLPAELTCDMFVVATCYFLWDIHEFRVGIRPPLDGYLNFPAHRTSI